MRHQVCPKTVNSLQIMLDIVQQWYSKSNQIKSNQILFKVSNVHLKEMKNSQEATHPTIFYNQ